MRARLLVLVLLSIALLLVGCGGGSHAPKPAAATQVHALPGHPCLASDLYMQCRAGQPQLRPLLGASVIAQGIDFAWGGPSCLRLKANGWSFGASYLSYDFSKNWSHGQFNEYIAHGCKTVFVWETGATEATNGSGAGASDAREALRQYRSYVPTGRIVIFFAIDCDCSGGSVDSYFRGVDSVLGAGQAGAYGGIRPLNYLFTTGLINWGWQTSAWSGGAWNGSQIEQYAYPSSAYDLDRAIATDYGQYPAPVATPPPPPPAPRWATPGCFSLSPFDHDFCFGQSYGLHHGDAKWRAAILNYRLRMTGWLAPTDKASYVDHGAFLALKAFQAKHGHIHDPLGTAGGQTWGELKRADHWCEELHERDAGAPFAGAGS